MFLDSLSFRFAPWRLAAGLLILQGFTWFALSAITIFRRSEVLAISATLSVVFGVLMIGNGLLMSFLAWGCFRERPWVRSTTIVYISLNLLLTLTDQFGWLDLLVLVMNVATVGALAATFRKVKTGQI